MLAEKVRGESRAAPAELWNNLWCSSWTFRCLGCGAWHAADQTFIDCCAGPFASLDLAETAAQRSIDKREMEREDYVGAVPVEA